MVFLYALVFITVVAFIFAAKGFEQMDTRIEIFLWNSPYFKIGVFSERYPLEDGSVEDEVGIHLLFVSFIFVFWKPND